MQAAKDPDANKIEFIGSKNTAESDKNRIESGCNFNNPRSGSVCTNFPFSQKFSDPHTTTYQCDEWPPALARQVEFNKKTYKNSLRCMPGSENTSLGSKLGNFVNDQGGPYPGRPSGAMNSGDFFRVDFLANIASADQSKVKFCKQQLDCGSDGFQIGMTSKPVGGGKIEAPYFLAQDNNEYALQNTVYKSLFQCSVELTRNGDATFNNIKLFDYKNTQAGTTQKCTLNADGNTCTVTGLPNDLQIQRIGKLSTKPGIGYEYAPGTANTNVNNFKWNNEDTGNGIGPDNDAGAGDRYCKVRTSGTTQTVSCWFPCYKTKDGQ